MRRVGLAFASLAIWLGASLCVGLADAKPIAKGLRSVLAAPDAPTGLTLGSFTTTTQGLSWTPPATGGTPDDYQIRFSGAGLATWTTFSDGVSTTPSATVTGLTCDANYDYQVRSSNASGTSAWTSSSTGYTLRLPGQPTSVVLGTSTATTQPISWTAPASGGALTDYEIQYAAASSGSWSTFADGTSTTASTTVTSLTADTNYDYRVRASNSCGSGSWSSTATGYTLRVPGQVTGVTAGTATATTQPLTWTAPSSGDALADYEIQYSPTGIGSWSTFADGTSTTASTTVTGLSTSTGYDYRVRATNSAGNGAYSTALINAITGSSGSPPSAPPGTYGATADTGANMDATAAGAYSAGTTYNRFDIVTSGGLYYVSDSDSNTGNTPATSPVDWINVSTFMYVSDSSGSTGASCVNTNPATAKLTPCKTLNDISKRTANLGGSALPPDALVVMERNNTYLGAIVANLTRVNVAISSVSGDGSTLTVTTSAAHRLHAKSIVTISGATPAGYNGTYTVVSTPTTTSFTVTGTTTGASSGTIVFSSQYGNHWFSTYGTGSRPVLKFSDDATSTAYGMGALSIINSNRQHLRVRNLELYGENSNVFYYTPGSGTFTVGETITCSVSGGTATLTRISAVSGRLIVGGLSGGATCLTGQTITGGTSGATGTLTVTAQSSTVSTGVGGVYHGNAYPRIASNTIHGFRDGGILIGSATTGAGTGDYAVIEDNFVYDSMQNGSSGAGIDQGYATGMKLRHNTVYNNGTAGSTLNHNMYFRDLHYSEISYNDVYMTANRGSSCLVMHGVNDHVDIHHNDFHACMNGIALNDGYGATEAAEQFRNFNIYANEIRDMGTVSGQTQGQPFDIACMQDGFIYDNLIVGNTGASSFADWRGTSAISGADDKTARLYIYHNTWVHTATVGTVITVAGASMVDIRFKNNIVYSASTGNSAWVKATTVPDAEYSADYNVTMQTGFNPYSWNGTTYGTIAAFRAASSEEASGILTTNILFANLGSRDFTLQGGSPAKNAGTNLSITADFANTARSGSTPSIGAYE